MLTFKENDIFSLNKYMQEEDETKNTEINADALEEVFGEDSLVDDDDVNTITPLADEDDEDDVDEIDIAFQANDEGYW